MKKINIVMIILLYIFTVSSYAAEKKLPLKELEPLSQKVVVSTKQMNLNTILNVIRNNTQTKIVLAPEYGSRENLMMELALPSGMMTLRDLLDVICIQLQGKWLATDNGNKVVINALPKQISEPVGNTEPENELYSIESEGRTLKWILAKLYKKSGAKFVVTGGAGNMKIEIIMHDATLDKILSHIAFLYNLKYSYNEGVYRIGQ